MRGMNATTRHHQDALQFRLILAATYPFFLAAAKIQSQCNTVDYKLMKAKEAFRQHRSGPIEDLWSHNARTERSVAKVGEPV